MTKDAEICESCTKTIYTSAWRLHTRQNHEDEDDKTFNSPGSGDKNKTILSNSDFRVDLERQEAINILTQRCNTCSINFTSAPELKEQNSLQDHIQKEHAQCN